MLEPRIIQFAKTVQHHGGRALIVGGWVRDHLFNHDPKDMDIEVFNLSRDQLEHILSEMGPYEEVGKAYGVYILKGLQADIALPRTDTNLGPGHRAFHIEVNPTLTYTEASKRRDFTINSMGYDPLTQEILDPHHGQQDFRDKKLRVTDPTQFADDPLRGLRAAQFIARFNLIPDDILLKLCASLDLSELPGERLFEEFKKLLLKADRPSLGLAFLRDSNQLRFFPELSALIDVPQNPTYHPEGDVWIHTLMVVDEAAKLRQGDTHEDLVLMMAALCHDFGKPSATKVIGDKVTSHNHEEAGVTPTKVFLNHLKAPHDLIQKVCGLVAQHLAPFLLTLQHAKDGAYRRLAHRLAQDGLTMEKLAQVARADHLGRTTESALKGECPDVDAFLERAQRLNLKSQPEQDAVTGKFLISKGYTPGPLFKDILDQCRTIQFDEGIIDPEVLLERVQKKGR